MLRVSMLDLSKQYEKLKEEIHTSLESVLQTSQFILGENVKKLENDVAQYSNVKYGIGVASGSDALHISLLALGVEAGDEVIAPSFTFFATAGAVARVGAKPVFVDIEPRSYNIDPNKIEDAITDRTKAIIPVHLYGQMANMEPIMAVAKHYNLSVVEDAAQAIGATHNENKAGEFGDTACFSFFPTKNLGAYGDGGMVVTNDSELADRMRVLRVHGSRPKYHHHVLGYNSRLDELQAAILNVKLPHLDSWNKARQERAKNYSKLLREFVGDMVSVPFVEDGNEHIFHQYTIRVKKRDRLQTYLKEHGISTMIYYPIPLHLQPVFKELGYEEGDLPETEKACREVISLPMYPEIKLEEQQYVVEKIAQFFREEQ